MINNLTSYPESLYADSAPPAELTASMSMSTEIPPGAVPVSAQTSMLPTVPVRLASCTLGDYGLAFGSQIMTAGEEIDADGITQWLQRINESLPWAEIFTVDTTPWSYFVDPAILHIYGVYHNGTYCFRTVVTFS